MKLSRNIQYDDSIAKAMTQIQDESNSRKEHDEFSLQDLEDDKHQQLDLDLLEDEFSLCDIPEDNSEDARIKTPYPRSSCSPRTASSNLSASSELSKEASSSKSRPWMVTSATPKISIIQDLGKTMTLTKFHEQKEQESWIK